MAQPGPTLTSYVAELNLSSQTDIKVGDKSLINS